MIFIDDDGTGSFKVESRFTQDIFLHNIEIREKFIKDKRLAGLSEATISKYKKTLELFAFSIGKRYEDMNANNIRNYMVEYQAKRNVQNVTMNDMRLIFSTFYNWMENQDMIFKSPMRKIPKIKYQYNIKKPFSDEDIVKLQDACKRIRDRAFVDFLYISGCRISEAISINIDQVDFNNREIIIKGKGSKERYIYFDACCKVHLLKYLESRKDNNPALFITHKYPYNRLSKTGAEYLIRKLGKKAHVSNCYPHRFRRTFATRLIDRQVPIEQVQKMLGHTKIETTLLYAQVSQESVKLSHSRFA